jgi:hypothetical protein
MMLTRRRTSLTTAALRRRTLTTWWPFSSRSAPVAVSGRRYGYAPWRFLYRGDLYRVCRVDAVRDSGGRLPRRYFTVRCADGGRYTLFQDLRAGTWHIDP